MVFSCDANHLRTNWYTTAVENFHSETHGTIKLDHGNFIIIDSQLRWMALVGMLFYYQRNGSKSRLLMGEVFLRESTKESLLLVTQY